MGLSVSCFFFFKQKTAYEIMPSLVGSEMCIRDRPGAMLAAEVVAAADSSRADGLLVFDTAGVTGHPDHMAATAAGLLAAEMLNLPILGWTLPATVAAQLNQELGAS